MSLYSNLENDPEIHLILNCQQIKYLLEELLKHQPSLFLAHLSNDETALILNLCLNITLNKSSKIQRLQIQEFHI